MPSTFSININSLITEPAFQKFTAVTKEPNFFNIVGQSRWERWNSAFWGWLLDPEGSHNLKDYVLNKFLLLIFTEKCVKPGSFEKIINQVLSKKDFKEIKVIPNEFDHTEYSIDAGNLDVYIEYLYLQYGLAAVLQSLPHQILSPIQFASM